MINLPTRFKIMGTHVEKRMEYIQKYVQRGSKFVLEREPENPYDTNAIKVMLLVRQGKHSLCLGYVPRGKAEDLAPMIDDGAKFKVSFSFMIVTDEGEHKGLIVKLEEE